MMTQSIRRQRSERRRRCWSSGTFVFFSLVAICSWGLGACLGFWLRGWRDRQAAGAAEERVSKNYLSFEDYATEMLGSTKPLPVPIVTSSGQGAKDAMALPAGTIIGVQVQRTGDSTCLRLGGDVEIEKVRKHFLLPLGHPAKEFRRSYQRPTMLATGVLQVVQVRSMSFFPIRSPKCTPSNSYVLVQQSRFRRTRSALFVTRVCLHLFQRDDCHRPRRKGVR